MIGWGITLTKIFGITIYEGNPLLNQRLYQGLFENWNCFLRFLVLLLAGEKLIPSGKDQQFAIERPLIIDDLPLQIGIFQFANCKRLKRQTGMQVSSSVRL